MAENQASAIIALNLAMALQTAGIRSRWFKGDVVQMEEDAKAQMPSANATRDIVQVKTDAVAQMPEIAHNDSIPKTTIARVIYSSSDGNDQLEYWPHESKEDGVDHYPQ
ncbi:hypothetical protein HAX54_038430 [Datura stramonium]|uniref:Uncharacterized protein n=1 Tax=Datura stramonium TaxID=4076 RepID=A0ABS8SJ12_DATST|nr:hypothetical protein [Datura stramonium]